MSKRFYIDNELCNSCGKCARICLEYVQIPGRKHVDPDNPQCADCLQCYTVCPRNAIKLYDADKEVPSVPEMFNSITDESLSGFLSYRRSIRSFERKAVDDDIVEKLIDKARYIPSGGNEHSYEFTVLKSDEVKTRIKDELTKIYRLKSKLLNSAVLRNAAKPLVDKQARSFLSDERLRQRIERLIKRVSNGEDLYFYNAPIVIVIHSRKLIPTPKEDSVLAGYNICLMAQTLGLGTCFVTLAQNAINDSKKCKEILNLSSQDNVNAVVILGYPAVRHQRSAPKPEKQIHWC